MSRVSVPGFSQSTVKGEIFVLFFHVFLHEMTFDDESDQFRGEVSSWGNYRDETFISYHSCNPDNRPKKNLSLRSEGTDQILLF